MKEIEVFDESDVHLLLALLKKDALLSLESADSVVHALVDIANSVNTVYGSILPKLLAASDASLEERRDILEDLREEFRHIEYHLHDAQLADL